MRTGIQYMIYLADWYTQQATDESKVGFFQIGGGIAGDFPICVVPMLHQDLGRTSVPLWGYFCQISDSTTSYGSYSGARCRMRKSPGASWARIRPSSSLRSDATIVAPLVFAIVLGQ